MEGAHRRHEADLTDPSYLFPSVSSHCAKLIVSLASAYIYLTFMKIPPPSFGGVSCEFSVEQTPVTHMALAGETAYVCVCVCVHEI